MALTDDAIEKIKQMIIEGQLKPGDKLPREPDLAEQLGLSRGSLREAVRALAVMRVLDVRQGDGTYVTSLTPGVLLETMSFVIDIHQDESALELFEVRRALEPFAAERAALLMSDEEVDALNGLVDELDDDWSLEQVVENDMEFHHRIAAASGNSVLCSLIDSVAGRTQRARLWRGVTEENAVARTVREHRAIVSAIAQRQPSMARAFTTAHIAGVEQWIRARLTEEQQ